MSDVKFISQGDNTSPKHNIAWTKPFATYMVARAFLLQNFKFCSDINFCRNLPYTFSVICADAYEIFDLRM